MKSWIVAPVLKEFGSTRQLMRFLNVVFAFIYLCCFYWAMKIIVGDVAALIVFLTPVWDSKFFLYAPTDFGPLLFQMIFIVLSIGGIARFYKSKYINWCFFANIMVGAVLYQKVASRPVFLVLLLANNAIYLKYKFRSLFSFRFFFDLLGSSFCVFLPLAPLLYYFYINGTDDFLGMTASNEKITLFTYFSKLYFVFVKFLTSFDGAYFARGRT